VGVRTLQNEPGADPSEVTREWALERPLPGLLLPIGGKYSSARADAALAVDRVLVELGRPAVPCQTGGRPFPWTPSERFDAFVERSISQGQALGLDSVTARCLTLRFGARSDAVHEVLADHHHLGARIHPQLPFCRAEIVYAVSHEMARTLEDVVRRRIPLVLLARIDQKRLASIAELAGDLLGWSDRRKDEEAWQLAGRLARTPFSRSAEVSATAPETD